MAVEPHDTRGIKQQDFTEAELWNFSPTMEHVKNANRIQKSAVEAFGDPLVRFKDLIPEYANTNNTNHGEHEKIDQGVSHPQGYVPNRSVLHKNDGERVTYRSPLNEME